MRRFLATLGVLTLVVACSSKTTTSSSSSGASTSSGSSGSTTPPAASTTEASVQVAGSCPAFVACGGTPSGTYDYSGGCSDVLGMLRRTCTGLNTTQTVVKVKGSIYFLADNALKRSVTIAVSGSVRIPASCVGGTCIIVEQGLSQYGFGNATCTDAGGGACDCTVSKTTPRNDSTTYTLEGNNVKTADGETYEICDDGASLKYKGKSAGTEEGSWELAKRE
jgi:hypothetical protein